VPIAGRAGILIETAQWLDGDRYQPYDHTEIYIGQADDAGPHGYTVSAYPSGHGRRPLPCPPAILPGALWSTGLIPLTPAQRAGIVAWCAEHQDVGYSWVDYAALTLRRLGISDPALRRRIASSSRMICSQYTDRAYSVNDVRLYADGRWDGFVTPGDLADLLQGKMSRAAMR
jgi:hypothetical protein